MVDDRVRYFLESKRGQGYDELLLKRTEVPFRLPARLKFARPPSEPNARVLGTLKVEEGRLVFDVSAIEMLPADLDRLESEVGKLRPDDFQGRRAWALWAERRGKELNDPKLEARGVALEGEALWIEAEPARRRQPGPGRPVGRRGRSPRRRAMPWPIEGSATGSPEPTTPAELDALARQIEATLPASADPKAAGRRRLDLGSTPTPGTPPPPTATPPSRPGRARPPAPGRHHPAVAGEASRGQARRRGEPRRRRPRTRLPDRPELADRLRQRGLDEAEARVAVDAAIRGRGAGPDVPRAGAGRPGPSALPDLARPTAARTA